MSNKAYNVLKEIAQIWIPAIATLYFALAEIWALPYGSEVVATLTAIDAFLGAVLKISTVAYNKKNDYEA